MVAVDVGGDKVGCELDSLEVHIEDFCEGRDHEGFCQPGNPFEQAMTAGKDGGKELFDDILLADDRFTELDFHLLVVFAKFAKQIADATWGFAARTAGVAHNGFRMKMLR